MADAKAMLSIKTLLQTTQGATGEMIAEGLSHALQDRPEERHDLQNALLKMAQQVLNSARSDAHREAEDTCKRRVEEAQAQLNACKAAVTNAHEALQQAISNAKVQKEKLANSQKQLTLEEQEQQRVEALDAEKAKEVGVFQTGRQEVVDLLAKIPEQGSGETILPYLRNENAQAPLVAALQSVLKKEASNRIEFDLVAETHLKSFLDDKVAGWDVKIETVSALKANVHAEALGAYAVKTVAKEHVQEATAELEVADKAVVAAEQKLTEAKSAEQQQDGVLSHYLTDLTLAQDRVRQCSEALESLVRLEAGSSMQVEVPLPAAGMEVDADASKDVVMDSEMGIAIPAA